METMKDQWLPGVGGRGINKWSIEDFQGSESILFETVMLWWTHVIIHLSKLIECKTPRVNPNVNYGPWVIMRCQCWFIDCNKCTNLVLRC